MAARHLTALLVAFGLVTGVAATPSPATAQNRGQYIPGVGGLNAGMQLPPGFSTGLFYLHYNAGEFKNAGGDELPVAADYTIQGAELLLGYTSPWQILGATYGLSAVLFWMKGNVSLERFDVSASESGFADAYFEPINLGWVLPRAHLRAAYGFIAPTGENGVTTDFWGHDFTFAATIFLDDNEMHQFSISSVTEFHQRKEHSDVTVGDNTNLEFAVGRLVPLNHGSQLLQVGLAGYAQWQFSDDKGSGTIPALADQQDRVWAFGPEIGFVLPHSEWSFMSRLEREFGARSRGEGYTFFGGVVKTF